jgi:hypothetical protein
VSHFHTLNTTHQIILKLLNLYYRFHIKHGILLMMHDGNNSIEIIVTADEEDAANNVTCPICWENDEPKEPPFSICTVHKQFCKNCLLQHVSISINEKKLPITCPKHECNHPIEDKYIQSITDQATYQRYIKFRQLSKNPNLRECSKCQTINAPINENHSSAITLNNKITCTVCGHIYCHVHGDAHSNPNVTCEEYLLSLSPEEKENHQLSMEAIENHSKPCPNCSVPIFKSGGCDHIVCQHCQNDFCFQCGTDKYMTGKAFRNCSHCGGTYFDHRHEKAVQRKIICCCPIWFLLYFIYVTFALLISTITCGCGCLCLCGKGVEYDEEDGKNRGNCCDILRSFGQILFLPLIQACLFFPSLQCCARCFFTKTVWENMGFNH